MWVFEEEYYIIHDFLLPGFYIAVQFFFTLTFTLLLVSVILTLGIFVYTRDDDRYMVVLLSNGASQVAGGNNTKFQCPNHADVCLPLSKIGPIKYIFIFQRSLV